MTPTLACYFRRSYFLGADSIPARGPMVVIASHAASFLDAILMGVMLKRPIHFYARGDIFSKAWARWILTRLHMIPIYSADLAKNDMHRNAHSFDKGAEILCNGGALLIFPEGLSRLDRNILPFKKGTSRIILQALNRDPDITVNVVPVGIHYSRHAFRADVQLVTGNILAVSAQTMSSIGNQAKAVNWITAKMQALFRQVALYVDQPDRSQLLEQQLEMLGHDEKGQFNEKVFRRQKQLCQSISEIPGHAATQLRQDQDRYFAQLNLQELHDSSFAGYPPGRWAFVFLLFGFPFFAAGALLNIAPYVFGRYVADTRVTRADFYTSVLVAVCGASYLLWLTIGLVLAWLSGSQLLLLIVLIAPLLGWISVRWTDQFRIWRSQVRYNTLVKSEPATIRSLRDLRRKIRQHTGGVVREVQDSD